LRQVNLDATTPPLNESFIHKGGGGGGGMMMMMMMFFLRRREDVPGRVGEEQDERQATRRVEQRQGPS
jgi:hypothetical protein